MIIEIQNSCWVEIDKDNKDFVISATGDNGNSIFIRGITKKYLKQLYKDISKFI